MKTNAIIREMIKEDKNIFKALNQCYGFNFELPFSVAKIKGSFTIGKILEEIEKKHNTADSKVVILVKSDKTWRRDKLMGVEIVGSGSNDFCITHHKRWYDFKTKLDDYSRKSDFNDERKIATACYIVAQKQTLLSGAYKEKTFDLLERFDDREQKRYKASRNSYRYYYGRKEDPVFDKSGYYLNDKRDNLKRRAEALRSEREKAGFLATDNRVIIENLRTRLMEFKKVLAVNLINATTSKEVSKIAESLKWYNGLEGAFKDFERLEEGENKKTFSSVGSFNRALADINKTLDNIAV